MNTSDPGQIKTVSLTPLDNKLASKNRKTVNQVINVVARKQSSIVPVERILGKAETCTIWGDPHVTPFDTRSQYGSHVVGFNWVIQSKDFNIQERQYSCAGEITCVDLLIIQYKDTVFSLSTDNRVKKMKITEIGNTVEDKTIKSTTGSWKTKFMKITQYGSTSSPKFKVIVQDGTFYSTAMISYIGSSSWKGIVFKLTSQRECGN
jgi:hypothetical protein